MISPVKNMIPPSPPDLSQAALNAIVRSINQGGRNLGVPHPPPPPPQEHPHRIDLRA